MSELGRHTQLADLFTLVMLDHLSIKTHDGLIRGCQCGGLGLGQSYTEHLRRELRLAGLHIATETSIDPTQKES